MSSPSDELIPRGRSTPAVRVIELRVTRGATAVLHGVTMAIRPGIITGLLGPSGSGKTTLLRSIVGTQVITSGTVDVLGRPAGSAELRNRVGYVTQSPSVYRDLRVIDNVRYFAALYGTPRTAVTEMIKAVGLWDQRDSYCADLSGGQLGRTSLACALIAEPELLVLDEPTVGLDPVLRVELWDRFSTLVRRGTTVLVSSHVMDEADHCADLLLLRDGRLLAHTTPSQLRKDTQCNSLEQAFLTIIRHNTGAGAR